MNYIIQDITDVSCVAQTNLQRNYPIGLFIISKSHDTVPGGFRVGNVILLSLDTTPYQRCETYKVQLKGAENSTSLTNLVFAYFASFLTQSFKNMLASTKRSNSFNSHDPS